MPATLFGRPIDLPPSWEDASTYTFYLDAEEAKAAPAGPPLRAGGTAAGAEFRPNVVVARQRQGDRDLERCADEQRRSIAEKLPAAKLVRQGKTKAAGVDAAEHEYHLALERPAPALVQWHLTLVRDGWCYHVCATTLRDRLEADRKAVRAAIDSWR